MSSEFAARLSPEDLNNNAAGDISLTTVQAFGQAAIASEAELREAFKERAGIIEHDAGLPSCRGRAAGRADHGDSGPEPGLSVGLR